MVIMPDGAKFKMNWKYITYVNHGNSIHFSIVPMYNGPDIVLFPNMENWEKDGAFSLEEREEIIFLLEHLNWKRNLKIVEANVPAQKSEKAFVQKGSLETTNAVSYTHLDVYKRQPESTKKLYATSRSSRLRFLDS